MREKCPNTELFLVRIFLCLDWIRRFTKSPYSVQIQENTNQKKSVFGHFSRSDSYSSLAEEHETVLSYNIQVRQAAQEYRKGDVVKHWRHSCFKFNASELFTVRPHLGRMWYNLGNTSARYVIYWLMERKFDIKDLAMEELIKHVNIFTRNEALLLQGVSPTSFLSTLNQTKTRLFIYLWTRLRQELFKYLYCMKELDG